MRCATMAGGVVKGKERRFPFLLLVFGVFFLPPFRAFAGDIAGFSFVSSAQYATGEREPAIVQSRDASGAVVKVPQTTCLEFRTDSSTGAFFESQTTAESSAALVVTMGKNTANRTVYYRDTASRTVVLSLRAALRPEGEERSCRGWPGAEWGDGWRSMQTVLVGAGAGAPAASAGVPVGAASSSGSGAGVPPPASGGASAVSSAEAALEPQVIASAKIPRTAVVGADVFFEAEAFGVKRDPLQNARFVWSFGDGAVSEGKRVLHGYHYPGEYVVVVEAASGEKSVSARGVVSVAPATLSIVRVVPGAEGAIEIENSAAVEVNLSRWRVRSNGSEFFIPEHTIILPKNILVFSGAVMKLIISPPDTALLYPNGSVAAVYASPMTPTAVPVPVSLSSPAPRAAASPPAAVMPVLVEAEKKGNAGGAQRSGVKPPEKENMGTAPSMSPRLSVPDSAAAESLRLGAAASAEKSVVPWAVAVASLTALAVAGFFWRGTVVQKPLTEAEKLSREAEQYDIVE